MNDRTYACVVCARARNDFVPIRIVGVDGKRGCAARNGWWWYSETFATMTSSRQPASQCWSQYQQQQHHKNARRKTTICSHTHTKCISTTRAHITIKATTADSTSEKDILSNSRLFLWPTFGMAFDGFNERIFSHFFCFFFYYFPIGFPAGSCHGCVLCATQQWCEHLQSAQMIM